MNCVNATKSVNVSNSLSDSKSHVEAAAHAGLVQRQRQVLMGELEALSNPPQPPPEPITEVVVVEEDQASPKLDYPDLHRWFWELG